MFHLIYGKVQIIGSHTFIHNKYFGIEVEYQGDIKASCFYLHPVIDERSKSIHYYGWDHIDKKSVFENIIKINGIGPKTAFYVSNSNISELSSAVENMDIHYFQKLPGVGPKTAKRLVVELKTAIKKDDLQKIQGDEKIIKEIIKYCKSLGYDSENVKNALGNYNGPITKQSSTEIIKRLISQL